MPLFKKGESEKKSPQKAEPINEERVPRPFTLDAALQVVDFPTGLGDKRSTVLELGERTYAIEQAGLKVYVWRKVPSQDKYDFIS